MIVVVRYIRDEVNLLYYPFTFFFCIIYFSLIHLSILTASPFSHLFSIAIPPLLYFFHLTSFIPLSSFPHYDADMLPLVRSNVSDLWSAEATGGNHLSLFHNSYILPPSVHRLHLTQRVNRTGPLHAKQHQTHDSNLKSCVSLSRPGVNCLSFLSSLFTRVPPPLLSVCWINSYSSPLSPFY